VYRGVPGAGHGDPAHQYPHRDGTRLELSEWQSLWRKALNRAEALVVFSRDSAAIVAAALPDLQDRIRLRPHDLLQPIDPVPNGEGQRRRDGQAIGVLGNINLQKGAAVLVALADQLRQRKGDAAPARLVVVGRVDPVFDLGPDVIVHGAYAPSDLPALVKRYGITCWLIPSIWPETFSFTTHECLATGLPVMAFDLGAQGAGVAQAENGHVIGLPPPDERSAPSLAVGVLAAFEHIQMGKVDAGPDG